MSQRTIKKEIKNTWKQIKIEIKHQNLQNAAEQSNKLTAALEKKKRKVLITLKKKTELKLTTNLIPQGNRKEKQTKSKVSRRKEINKDQLGNMKSRLKKQQNRSLKLRDGFLLNIYKTDKLLARLTKRKKIKSEKKQVIL